MIRTAVYDFFGSNKYYFYESSDDGLPSLKNQLDFDSIMVNIPLSNNLKPYLIDHNNPNTEDFKKEYFNINYANLKYSNNPSVKGIEQYFSSTISYRWNIFNALSHYNNLTKSSKKNLAEDLENYLNYQKGIIKERFNNIETNIVIPVHDDLTVEAQELLLSKFKDRDKTTLLWKSVAAYLATRDKVLKYNLQDNDKIVIIDRAESKCIHTQLTLVKEKDEKHLIPMHKSYSDPYGNINDNYYEDTEFLYDSHKIKTYVQALHHPNTGKFPSEGYLGEWTIKDVKEKNKMVHLNHYNSEDKLIILIDNNLSIDTFSQNHNIIKLPETLVSRGAFAFIKIKKEGKIPYFDHCDGLHMVYQKTENGRTSLEYSTLIDENDRAEGGKIIEGAVNDDLFIAKNSNLVDFLLRIGTKDRSGKLKELKQTFDIESLKHKCPISIKPYMTPGQGRAKVVITCEKYGNIYGIEEKPFDQVLLDWKKLEDSNETVESMEAKLPKSFPPPMALVKTRFNREPLIIKQENIKGSFINYIRYGKIAGLDLNETRWPNKDKNTVERFQRTNIFGNEENYRIPYLGPDTEDILTQFFNKLADNCFKGKIPNESILLIIAWTYQGKSQGYFNPIIDYVINEIKHMRLTQAESSLLVNLLEDNKDDDDLIIVFKSCLRKFKSSKQRVNQWMRCLYQLLMYHEFISSPKITNEECIDMMEQLIIIYKDSYEKGKANNSNYALRSMLFLLKRRIVFPEFCKEGADDGLFYKIINLKTQNTKDAGLLKTIIEFLKNNGSLSGIPLN